jgi:hypothetical protein
MTIRKR